MRATTCEQTAGTACCRVGGVCGMKDWCYWVCWWSYQLALGLLSSCLSLGLGLVLPSMGGLGEQLGLSGWLCVKH